MHDIQLGRLPRAMRQRRHWRQQDLAERAGVGRTVLVDFEAGRLGGMRLATLRRIAAPLGFSLEVTPRGLGAEADRVLDQGHAFLLGATSVWLVDFGWRCVAEVSYSEWGERGSIDLLAWHEPTATLLVVEIKTELVSIEATLRKLDEKTRLAPAIATARFGWQPAAVGRLLVLPDVRSERRRAASHGAVLDGALPVRSYAARSWCRSPVGSTAALLFLSQGRGVGSPPVGHTTRIRRPVRTNVADRPAARQGLLRRAGSEANSATLVHEATRRGPLETPK
ncbi:MAG: helix-turn-helix transcriptional regulator [Candidatus Limnocylindrales bacterium]